MKEIVADKSLIAYCGLYCGACRSYLNDQCPGCAKNEKASWCKVRACCIDHQYASCADCKIKELAECAEFNSFMAKVFAFIFNSNRSACVRQIRDVGYETFAQEMASKRTQTIKR